MGAWVRVHACVVAVEKAGGYGCALKSAERLKTVSTFSFLYVPYETGISAMWKLRHWHASLPFVQQAQSCQ